MAEGILGGYDWLSSDQSRVKLVIPTILAHFIWFMYPGDCYPLTLLLPNDVEYHFLVEKSNFVTKRP